MTYSQNTFLLVSWQLTWVKCGKPRPPGSPLGKNKHWELFANVIRLWSTQQLFWVCAIHKYMSTWGRFTASESGARFCLGVRGWLTKYVSGWSVCVCVCMRALMEVCVCIHVRLCRWTCTNERETRRVSGWRDVWAWLAFVQKKLILRKCGDWCVCVCVWKRHCIYLCFLDSQAAGGYCGASGWSRVNSSLTPVHYGPLLSPLRWRHSQPPSFTHKVNHSGQTHRHRGGAKPASLLVRNTTCVCVLLVRVYVWALAELWWKYKIYNGYIYNRKISKTIQCKPFFYP